MRLSPAGKKRARAAATRRALLGLDAPPQPAPKTFYNSRLATKICRLLAKGRSVIQICRRPGMPNAATIYAWLQVHPAFLEMYLFARRFACQRLIDEILEIADDSSEDFIIRKLRDGREKWIYNPNAIRRAKLRISARRWLLDRYTVKGLNLI